MLSEENWLLVGWQDTTRYWNKQQLVYTIMKSAGLH